MRSKLIKRSLIGLSVIVVLFLALGIHLYYVTDNFYQQTGSNANLQMSRIDFKQDVDSTEAIKISSTVNSLEGVQKSYFNVKDNILVYSYYKGKQTSQNVYDKLMASGNYVADKFTVSADEMTSGCPVLEGNKSAEGLLLVYKKLFSIF